MKAPETKRAYWPSDATPRFAQTYAGAVDFANGLDTDATFESHLKFQALFFEKIIVPDSYFYTLAPIVESVRRLRSLGQREDENVTLQLLRSGVIVATLRHGESLLDNWIQGGKGIRPGELGYLTMEEGKRVLELIEPHVAAFTRWPTATEWTKPAYGEELHRLFVNGAGGNPWIGREELIWLEQLKGCPTKGWHSLFDRFQESIVTQMKSQDFRRAGLEQAVVDHFCLPRFNEVYEFLNQRAKIRDHERWPEVAVARRLLQISSTIYEAYHAGLFNCIGSLFPGYFRPVVNAELYSRVSELNAGRPYSGGDIVPPLCIDPAKISLKNIIEFRHSGIFDQYCGMLRQLKSGGPNESFVDLNAQFYKFLETSYLPAILQEFSPAVDRDRLKQLGRLAQAVSIVGVGTQIETLFTHTSGLGLTLFVTVGTCGKAVEKAADGIAQLTSSARNAWLMRRAKRHLNGFIAMESESAGRANKPLLRSNGPKVGGSNHSKPDKTT